MKLRNDDLKYIICRVKGSLKVVLEIWVGGWRKGEGCLGGYVAMG